MPRASRRCTLLSLLCLTCTSLACSSGPGAAPDAAGLSDAPSAETWLPDGTLTRDGSAADTTIAPDAAPLLPRYAIDWSLRYGDEKLQYAYGVAVDKDGNIALTGQFQGTLDFGSGVLSAAGYDAYLAVFDAQGQHRWSKHFGDGAMQNGWSVAFDEAGNVILAGSFYGAVDLGEGPLSSAGMDDIFLAKFAPEGELVWVRHFGSSEMEHPERVVTRPGGEIVLVGSTSGSLDFGAGALEHQGGADLFVAAFSPAGDCLWSRGIGDAKDQYATGLAVAADGAVVLSGSFLGTVTLGQHTLRSAGLRDMLVAKLSADGNPLWARRFGDWSDQFGGGVALDAAGNVFLSLQTDSAVDFGGGALKSAGKEDLFLAKLDRDGQHLWSRRFGDEAAQTVQALGADAAGNLLFAASFRGTVDLGDGPLVSAGEDDVLLAKLDPAGALLWSERFGDAAEQRPDDLTLGPDGTLLVCGQFRGQLDFGSGALQSAGEKDLFLAAFKPAP